MADESTDRQEGVDFTDINPILEELSYPVTAEELIEEHGDREFGRTNADPITVEELFGPMGEDTFESADEVRQSALTMMPEESVGREEYSDRGASNDTGDEEGDTQDESF